MANEIMKHARILLTFVLLAFLPARVQADAAPSPSKPNLVFFLVDDMGWQETSVPFHTETTALNRRYRTPNMERLAAQGMKFTQAYEGDIRETMIVNWPGVTKPGSVCRTPVAIEDYFPTILELAGVAWRGKTVQAVDGISFVPLLKGEGQTAAERAFLWHFPNNYGGQGPFSAVRQGPWKLIYHHADRRRELFNLDQDIGETRDLAEQEPARTAALSRLLADRLQATEAQMPVDKATGRPVELPGALHR